MRRREAIACVGASLLLTGCLESESDAPGTDDDPESDENGGDGDEPGDSNGRDDPDLERLEATDGDREAFDSFRESMDEVEFESLRVGSWLEHGEPAGYGDLYGSAESIEESHPFALVDADREEGSPDGLETDREELEAFVAETDFERSRLLYVVGFGRGTVDVEIGLEELGTTEDTLVGTATVQDPAAGDDVRAGTAVLARVPVDGDGSPPDRALVRVDSRHGEGVLEATTD